MSYETNPGCLGYIEDCTAQLYGDYNITIIMIPIKQPVFHGKDSAGLFSWLIWMLKLQGDKILENWTN